MYRALALLLAAAGFVFAQSKTDWASLNKLAAGEPIRVSMTDGKSYKGEFQSVSADSLVMVAASTQQSLAHAQVAKVSLKGESHRGRNTLIGLGVGAAGGLAIGAGADAACSRDCFLGNNIGKAIFTPLGAIIGTIVGAVWPTGGWHDVYRAK